MDEHEEDVDEIRRWLDEIIPGEPTDHLRVVGDEVETAAALQNIEAHVKVDTAGHVVRVYCNEDDCDVEAITRLASGLPHLQSIGLAHTQATDEGIALLSQCTTIRELDISDTRVTGVGLRSLRTLRELRKLVWTPRAEELNGIQALAELQQLTALFVNGAIGDEEARHLGELTQLRELDLGATQISSDGLPHLRSLCRLRLLNLGETAIDNDGLVHLAPLRLLEDLSVESTVVSDEGAGQIAAFDRLEDLSLSDCRIGDKGVACLARMPALKSLHLMGTAVGDASLTAMQSFPCLREIWIYDTKITREGVRRFLREAKSCSLHAEDEKM